MDSLRGRLTALMGNGDDVALVDGTRLHDCQLASVSRRVPTVWIVRGGDDVFVPLDAVAEVREVDAAVRHARSRAA